MTSSLASVLSALLAQAPTPEELQEQITLDSLVLPRGLLLLHRRDHVVDPRRLHGVRGGRRTPQEHHVDGDEEHPHHRRGHANVLLLRLVHLRLLRARRPGRGPLPARPSSRAFCGLTAPWSEGMGGEPGVEPQRPPERSSSSSPSSSSPGRPARSCPAPSSSGSASPPTSSSRSCSAPASGSWTRPGAGAPAAGSPPTTASTTRSPRSSSTASPVPSRSACSSTWGHASGSTTSRGGREPSDRTTRT